MDGKSWYASKTIWYAVLYAVIVWGAAWLGGTDFADYAPSDNLVQLVALLTPVVMVTLRWVTKRAIEI